MGIALLLYVSYCACFSLCKGALDSTLGRDRFDRKPALSQHHAHAVLGIPSLRSGQRPALCPHKRWRSVFPSKLATFEKR